MLLLKKEGNMNFIEALQYCISHKLVFAAYRLPHSDAIRLLVQKNAEPLAIASANEIIGSKGFLLAPFERNEKNCLCLIEPDLNYLSTDYVDFDELVKLPCQKHVEPEFDNGIIGKKEFIAQVEDIKKAIREQVFEKVVVSRIKVLERNYRSKLTELFQLLIASYPNAFVYMFNTGNQLWMGATPEPLLCSNKNELMTVSLAGTREYNAENLNIHNWGKKERMEQELVTRFIENSLGKLDLTYTMKTGPYTKKAGNLIHLRTDFILDFNAVNGKVGALLNELHPTSAVCGLPKREALQFLVKHEKHNRGYYSGFLGPVNLEEKFQLFVNLRCMRIFDDKLILYVGAGITIDSVADDEWNETEIKADTLLSIIHKV
jgi:isochorismate synthase